MQATRLQRAWKAATTTERLQFTRWIIRLLTEGEELITGDFRILFPHGGRKPRQPSQTAPQELVTLVHGHGWTQTMVASALEVHNVTVWRWWKGDSKASSYYVGKLKKVISDLQRGETPSTSKTSEKVTISDLGEIDMDAMLDLAKKLLDRNQTND